jgi:hypothetical protein
MPMTNLALAASAIFALLGLVHLSLTLRDFGPRPRYFQPSDATLLDAMRQARTALAPDGRDYWSGVLGFNLSHSLGVLQFALLISLATLFEITWLKPVLVIVGAAYAAISFRCWFPIPTASILLATALMITGWWTA